MSPCPLKRAVSWPMALDPWSTLSLFKPAVLPPAEFPLPWEPPLVHTPPKCCFAWVTLVPKGELAELREGTSCVELHKSPDFGCCFICIAG